jgi:branched-chain amino acid aminotransferase
VIIAATAAPVAPESTSVITVSWPRNERAATAGLKTTSYVENVMALAEAQRHGATEAIFATTTGLLCEGTGSNIFYVIDGELRTPTLASGCLPGVTRALVLDWFGGRNIDEPIEVAENADEVFLVSTLRDVQAVTRWGDREIVEGPVTQAARARWRERESELLGR